MTAFLYNGSVCPDVNGSRLNVCELHRRHPGAEDVWVFELVERIGVGAHIPRHHTVQDDASFIRARAVASRGIFWNEELVGDNARTLLAGVPATGARNDEVAAVNTGCKSMCVQRQSESVFFTGLDAFRPTGL